MRLHRQCFVGDADATAHGFPSTPQITLFRLPGGPGDRRTLWRMSIRETLGTVRHGSLAARQHPWVSSLQKDTASLKPLRECVSHVMLRSVLCMNAPSAPRPHDISTQAQERSTEGVFDDGGGDGARNSVVVSARTGHADRPFRAIPITHSGKAITRGVTPLGRSTSPASGPWSSRISSS
jgi:hypothetical protein